MEHVAEPRCLKPTTGHRDPAIKPSSERTLDYSHEGDLGGKINSPGTPLLHLPVPGDTSVGRLGNRFLCGDAR